MKLKFLKFILPVGLAVAVSAPVMAASSNVFDYTRIDNGLTPVENQNVMEAEELTEAQPVEGMESAALPPLENHYIHVEGTISDVSTDGSRRILVEREDGDIYYNISDETLIYSMNSMDRVNADRLTEGRRVSVFYNVYTPQTMSLPPQVNPEVIVLNDSEETTFVKVDYFNEDLLSSDNALKLSRTEEMTITGFDNRLKTFDEARDHNLLVFYTTRDNSLSNQLSPVKVVVLNSAVLSDAGQIEVTEPETEAEEETGTEENNEETAEPEAMTKEQILAQLNEEDFITREETRFVALYRIAEITGFELEWDANTGLITLRRPGSPASYTINNDASEYGYNRAMMYFTHAPFIMNDRTYVEEAFLDVIQ